MVLLAVPYHTPTLLCCLKQLCFYLGLFIAAKPFEHVLSRTCRHLHHVLAAVAGHKVAIRVRRAVAAIVDTLLLALLAGSVHIWADPHNVVRREGRPVALKLPSHRHKLLHATMCTLSSCHCMEHSLSQLALAQHPRNYIQVHAP